MSNVSVTWYMRAHNPMDAHDEQVFRDCVAHVLAILQGQ